jgi:hypothetical protein
MSIATKVASEARPRRQADQRSTGDAKLEQYRM